MSKPPVKLPQQEQQLFSEAVSGITPLQQDKIIPSTDNNNRVFVSQSSHIDADDSEIIDRLSDEYDPFGDLQSNDQQRNDLNYPGNLVNVPTGHSIVLQFSWAMGPHKHDAY